MKNAWLIIILIFASSPTLNSNTLKNTKIIIVSDVEKKDVVGDVVDKLNSLEMSLNTLNENLIKLDSIH